MSSADLVRIGNPRGRDAYLARAEARFGKPPEPADDAPRFYGDCILQHRDEDTPISADFSNAPYDHPNIERTRQILKMWPEAYEELHRFINVWQPLNRKDEPAGEGSGSSSGHEIWDNGLRTAYVTVYDPVGSAAGLLHELGHLRMLTLGIELETHDGEFLQNKDDELFVSAIRKDKRRPMGAVLHAHLAWLYMTELHLRLIEQGLGDKVLSTMLWNLPKLEEGLMTLQDYAIWTDYALPFSAEVYADTLELVDLCYDELGWDKRDAANAANKKWVESTEVPESPLHGTEPRL